MHFIKDIKEGEQIKSIYLVKNKSIGTTKNGNEYYSIVLQDKTGTIDAKVWDTNSPSIEDFQVGDFVEIQGSILSFNNANQVKVDRVRNVDKDEYNVNDYFNTSTRDVDQMIKELEDIIKTVKHKDYSRILKSIFIENKKFREQFINHQGGKMVHHSFVHGLLEHTLYVTKIGRDVAKNYEDVSIDLVTTACLCHDIGKVREISYYPINEYTDEGNLIGHIVLSYELVQNEYEKLDTYNEKNKNELLHCILSHHGFLEYGSPKLPSLIEAYIVSSVDNIDSKIEILREGIFNSKLNKKFDSSGFVGFNKFLSTNYRETERE